MEAYDEGKVKNKYVQNLNIRFLIQGQTIKKNTQNLRSNELDEPLEVYVAKKTAWRR